MRARLVGEHLLTAQLRSFSLLTRVRMGETDAVRAAVGGIEDEHCPSELRTVLAAVHLAEGNPQQAVDVLAPAIQVSASVLHPVDVIQALLLDAVAHDQLGDRRGAEQAVERALELAEPDGIVLPFTTAPVQELLERHPRHRTAHATLQTEILAVLGGLTPSPRGAPAPPMEALSDAELRVLRYLPSNLTAPAIAAELSVSTNTVKTHMRHIYTKLDTHDRAGAVERARQLGLLGPRITRTG